LAGISSGPAEQADLVLGVESDAVPEARQRRVAEYLQLLKGHCLNFGNYLSFKIIERP
jgi:hypothetical protein